MAPPWCSWSGGRCPARPGTSAPKKNIEPSNHDPTEDLKTVIVDGRYIMIYTTWDIESTIICNIYIYTYVCVHGLGGLVKKNCSTAVDFCGISAASSDRNSKLLLFLGCMLQDTNHIPIEIDGLPIKNGDFPWRTVK